MDKFIYIFLGGGIGSVARYMISGWSYKWFGTGFPFGTLSVNIIGSFLIGALWAFSEDVVKLSPNGRNFLFVGFLGGFTTFSTYTLDTLNLIRGGEYSKATLNVLSMNIAGLILVIAGFILARYIMKK